MLLCKHKKFRFFGGSNHYALIQKGALLEIKDMVQHPHLTTISNGLEREIDI